MTTYTNPIEAEAAVEGDSAVPSAEPLKPAKFVGFLLETEALKELDRETALRSQNRNRKVSRAEVLREYVDMGLDLDREWRKDNPDAD